MCTIQMQCRLQLSVDSVTAQDNWNDLLIHSDLEGASHIDTQAIEATP